MGVIPRGQAIIGELEWWMDENGGRMKTKTRGHVPSLR